jgi:hypothetical protein
LGKIWLILSTYTMQGAAQRKLRGRLLRGEGEGGGGTVKLLLRAFCIFSYQAQMLPSGQIVSA